MQSSKDEGEQEIKKKIRKSIVHLEFVELVEQF